MLGAEDSWRGTACNCAPNKPSANSDRKPDSGLFRVNFWSVQSLLVPVV